jgi:subtilisin family serine protease
MSGTSMASPLAARYATMVLAQNPDLTPTQLKKILLNTVDKKDWLKDKVRTGGVINVKRAMYAASLVKNGKSINEAIAQANEEIPDMTVRFRRVRVRKTAFDRELSKIAF